jgi:hypothetical protein
VRIRLKDKKHREADLPYWARVRLRELRRAMKAYRSSYCRSAREAAAASQALSDTTKSLGEAKATLREIAERSLYRIPLPRPSGFGANEEVHIFYFLNNRPCPYAVLNPGDTLTIQRKKRQRP